MVKRCSNCGIDKPFECFVKGNNKYGLSAYCNPCRAEYARSILPLRRKRYAELQRNRRKLNPDLVREIEKKSARGSGRFGRSRKEARRHGWDWTIERAEYDTLIFKPCTYHGGPLTDTGIGLDRLDNTRGYHLDNVVPCCWICNTTRSNIFTPKEMEKIGRVIFEIFHDRGLNNTPRWVQNHKPRPNLLIVRKDNVS